MDTKSREEIIIVTTRNKYTAWKGDGTEQHSNCIIRLISYMTHGFIQIATNEHVDFRIRIYDLDDINYRTAYRSSTKEQRKNANLDVVIEDDMADLYGFFTGRLREVIPELTI